MKELEAIRTDLWLALNGCGSGDEEKGFSCGETHLCENCLQITVIVMEIFDEVEGI